MKIHDWNYHGLRASSDSHLRTVEGEMLSQIPPLTACTINYFVPRPLPVLQSLHKYGFWPFEGWFWGGRPWPEDGLTGLVWGRRQRRRRRFGAWAIMQNPLTPLRFLQRAAGVHPDRTAIIDGARTFTIAGAGQGVDRACRVGETEHG